ncbi:MAG: hypothetical protein ACK443_01065 [Methylococcaceae bacterium]|jgi:hypothetical protein
MDRTHGDAAYISPRCFGASGRDSCASLRGHGDGAQCGHGLSLAVAGGVFGRFAAFWFAAIADHIGKDAVTKLQLRFVRDRENLVVTAEVGKRVALDQSHPPISREIACANSRANPRLGYGRTGLLAVGGLLVAVEFMTLGLLLMTTADGALGGSIVRVRQEARWVRKDRPVMTPVKRVSSALAR